MKRKFRPALILAPFLLLLLTTTLDLLRKEPKIPCESGCYTIGTTSPRIIITSTGYIYTTFSNNAVLTPLTTLPLLSLLVYHDPLTAATLLLLYITSITRVHFTAPLQQPAQHTLPRSATCIIVGFNDFVESINLRKNHSCGYINYIYQPNITDRFFVKPQFADTTNLLAAGYDLIFIDRDVEVDVGRLVESVPDNNIAIGWTGRNYGEWNALKEWQPNWGWEWEETTLEKGNGVRVVITRLSNMSMDGRATMIRALKEWATFPGWVMHQNETLFPDPLHELYNRTFSDFFVVPDKAALRKRCSPDLVNRSDCLKGRLDTVLPVNWSSLLGYCALVAALYVIYASVPEIGKNPHLTGMAFVVGTLLCVSYAIVMGVVGRFQPWQWPRWYTDAPCNSQPQIVLVVVVATRFVWKFCRFVERRRVDDNR